MTPKASVVLCLLLATPAPAAPVTWSPPATVAADADVFTAGALKYAYHWVYNGVAANPVVNGVTFTGSTNPTAGGGDVGLSGYNGYNQTYNFGGTTTPFTSLSASYQAMLAGTPYNSATTATVTLKNLTVGNAYAVQVWLNDSRIYGQGRAATLTSAGGNSVTLDFNSTDTANANGGVGQYSTGTFTADADTQSFTITGVAGTGNGAGASAQLNALQLRDHTPVPPTAPVITSQPQAQSVALGGTATLSAAATGTGPLAYQWARNGTPLDGATAATLTLTNITAAQAGDYTVTVTNEVSAVTSEPAHLAVVDPLDPANALDLYNPVWTSPSANDRGAMPLGNGEVGLMLWLEANGDLQFYISRTDTRTELDRLVKLGKVRLNLTPNPFATGQPYRQELLLRDGRAEITAGPPASRVTLRVFVDADSPTIYISGTSAAPLTARATYETWRTADYTGNSADSPVGGSGYPNLYESADVVSAAAGAGHIAFYHRNAWSCVPQTAQCQFMTPYLADIPDPLVNLTFGGRIELTNATVNGANSLLTTAPVSGFDLKITTHAAQTATADDWLAQVAHLHAQAPAAAEAMTRTAQWWHSYWNRSWLFTRGDVPPDPTPMGKNNQPLRLGADSSGSSLFSGAMARASFYNRVLTAAEIAALATGAPDADVTVTSGLAASWLLGDTAAGTCPGRLGTTAALTTTGAVSTTTAGGVSHARLDGGHFSTPDDSRFEPLAGATMEAWIYLDAAEANSGRLFDKVTANQQDGYLFDLYPGRALRLYNGFDHAGTAANALATGAWVHVLVTYDNFTKERALWHNGVRVAYTAGTTVDSGEPTPSVVTRSYVLTKWMSACGARGHMPIMFNGSLWTVNPNTNPITLSNNPDYRNWGHTYFYQNTRLNYTSMPARGELDFMQPFFNYYDRFQALNRGRAVAWHGAGTQGQFNNEMTTSFGLIPGGIYGYNRTGLPNWYTNNQWGGAVTISPGLELLALMLDAYDHSGDTVFLQTKILPYAADLFRFIETRYPARVGGKISMNPVHALETFWNTTNSMPVVAGMNAVLDRILALPAGLLTAEQSTAFAAFKALTPPLPVQTKNGRTVFAPAQTFTNSRQNVEEPEHYATFPFRLCNIGLPNRQMGIDTFEQISLANNYYKPFALGGPTYVNSFSGWQQTPMVAALLGRTADAKRALTANCRLRDSNYRLPAFWGQIYDSVPDGDHGANLLNTAQLMAFQTLGDKIFLLPAWPADWDVAFKFHAPRNTTVSGRYHNGTLDKLEVTPASRANDVVLMADVPVNLSGSATVTGYDAWRMVRFTGTDLTAPAAWIPAADPDNDGIENILEYVLLGGDPTVSNPGILPTLDASGANLVFSFTRRTAATGTTQVFQYGTNLTGWTDVPVVDGTYGDVIVAVSRVGDNDNVVITVPKGANTKLFGRLQVSKP